MSRRMPVTYAQRWRQRMAAEAHARDAKDPGCLEHCAYCPPPEHVGATCNPATCPGAEPIVSSGCGCASTATRKLFVPCDRPSHRGAPPGYRTVSRDVLLRAGGLVA